MSEYQYHEWQSVDRVLTADEQAAVQALSSHIEVSSSRAVVTYHWSSFKHDPKQVLLKYFDGYFYLANWGSLQLMFRFPKGLLDEVNLERYLTTEALTLETIGRYQVLDLDFNPEDGKGWMREEAGLSQFIQLRADLLAGDYRLLYLAWLKSATLYGAPDTIGNDDAGDDDADGEWDDLEPPVPPGLMKLSPPLQSFVQVFGLDPFLVTAAAEASPDPARPLAVNQRKLLGRLPPEERDDFLLRLAEGDPGVGLALRKRLADLLPREQRPPARPRSIRQLVRRARQLEAGEQRRQAEAARQKHIAAMTVLAKREAQTWQQVDALLATGRKIGSVYVEATTVLDQLSQLAEFQHRQAKFRTQILALAKKYASRPALIERWRRRGWV